MENRLINFFKGVVSQMITLVKTSIEGVLIIKPKVFEDRRGYFIETYNKKDFEENNLFYDFVQDNQSKSTKGVLRGLHFQKTYQQAKLVRVINGVVFDVAVDLRKGSKTYGKWVGVILSSENREMLLIPRGFAHGFLVLSDIAEFTYKCDNFYHPEDEGGIIWNDPDIQIQWPVLSEDIVLSDKDKKHPSLKESSIEL